MSVTALTAELGVSEATIRRDLVGLDDKGALRRTHGGARRLTLRGVEPPFSARAVSAPGVKARIAAAAIDLLAENESIVLDSGTTCLEVAKRLSEKASTVMPLSLPSLAALSGFPQVTLSLCAGSVRPNELSVVGPLAIETIERFRFDTAIISGCGFSLSDGLTAYDVDDAAVKGAAIRSSSRAILLCDEAKWGELTFVRAAATKAFTTIITDHQLTADEARIAADLEVDVITV
ncbi:MAG: DeoR/GlpR family DNA-binding transcription regulator [Brevundimonas sp.]